MNFQNINKALNDFGKYVVQQSRSRLTKGNQGGGALYDSIRYTLDEEQKGFILDFYMEDYGKFQDKGVSGTEKKYDTPFSYKTSMPPIEPVAKWAKRKGLKLREVKGRFKKNWNKDSSYRTIGFLIARSIQQKAHNAYFIT